ncbi:MAG: PRD domain-containing protein [Bacillota bacterium]
MLKNYKIIKVMNNNIILAKDLKLKNEAVLIAKGIGFGKNKDQTIKIADDEIEKTFVTHDKSIKKDYYKLVNSIDNKIIEICSKIILKAEKEFGKLNSRVHIVLTDHISFAIERIKNGQTIENPFINEIKTLYPKEYKLGCEAREKIQENFDIDIGKGEIGFIALHLNAARQNVEVKKALKNTRLIKELVKIIENELDYKIKDSITYNRLIDHLKGCIDRVESKTTVVNPLMDVLKTELSEAFKISKKIKKVLDKNLDYEIPEGELGYLTIHINRIRKLKNT